MFVTLCRPLKIIKIERQNAYTAQNCHGNKIFFVNNSSYSRFILKNKRSFNSVDILELCVLQGIKYNIRKKRTNEIAS